MKSGDYKYIRQAGDWPNWRREVCQEWMGTAVHQLYRVIALKLRQRPLMVVDADVASCRGLALHDRLAA